MSGQAAARAEALYRATWPVFVNSFDQLGYLRDTLIWLKTHGFANVTVLDQNSSFVGLIDWYDTAEFRDLARLHPLGENVGPRAALNQAAALKSMPHIFTDPDLGLPASPRDDFVTRLFSLSLRYKAHKVGLALDISDAAAFQDVKVTDDTGAAHSIVEWESRFWKRPLGDDVYRANVDTTFHLWNPSPGVTAKDSRRRLFGRPIKTRCLRVAGPGFLATHRPWRRDDAMTAEEDDNYRRTAFRWTTWVGPTEATSPNH
jgi:hypothetical protein